MKKLQDKFSKEIIEITSELKTVTNDWNNDGERYSIEGYYIKYNNGITGFLSKNEIDHDYEKLS